MLLCSVGSRACAVPIEHVVETMRPLPVEPVAALGAASAVVRGLAIVRGVPVPVVDAGALLGGVPLQNAGRFVTLRAGERRVALAVDAVRGVERLSASSFGDLPPLLRDAADEVVSKIGALDAAILVVLDASRLVPEETWRALEEGASS